MRKNTYEGVCACAIKVSCDSLWAPPDRTLCDPFSPFNACSFEFQVIGVEDSPTTRSGGRLFCYHVSSQTDVNLRKGERERERERERGRERGKEGEMERWSAVAGSEGGGENKERPCCAPDSSCCSFFFLTGSQCFVPFFCCAGIYTQVLAELKVDKCCRVHWEWGSQVTWLMPPAQKKGGKRKKVAVTAAW